MTNDASFRIYRNGNLEGIWQQRVLVLAGSKAQESDNGVDIPTGGGQNDSHSQLSEPALGGYVGYVRGIAGGFREDLTDGAKIVSAHRHAVLMNRRQTSPFGWTMHQTAQGDT
jgi:hypothetical protein